MTTLMFLGWFMIIIFVLWVVGYLIWEILGMEALKKFCIIIGTFLWLSSAGYLIYLGQ